MQSPDSKHPLFSVAGLVLTISLGVLQYRTGHGMVFGFLMFCGGGFLEQFFTRLRYRLGGFPHNGS